jgi:DNA-binding MarR family transcriptional regulator
MIGLLQVEQGLRAALLQYALTRGQSMQAALAWAQRAERFIVQGVPQPTRTMNGVLFNGSSVAHAQMAMLAALQRQGPNSAAAALAAELGIKRQVAAQTLVKLRKRGLVEVEGAGTASRWNLTQAGRDAAAGVQAIDAPPAPSRAVEDAIASGAIKVKRCPPAYAAAVAGAEPMNLDRVEATEPKPRGWPYPGKLRNGSLAQARAAKIREGLR